MAQLRALRRLPSALEPLTRVSSCFSHRTDHSCNPKPKPSFCSVGLASSQAEQTSRMYGGPHAVANSSEWRLPARCCPDQRRLFSSPSSSPEGSAVDSSTETISVTFVDKHGDEKTIKVPLGMSMLEAAHQNDIELEGACEGSLACSTCHVIITDEKYYSKLSEPTDEENDMLDLAFGLTELSRLGCQVIAKPELDGMRLALPSATRNFAVDGYVPKPH